MKQKLINLKSLLCMLLLLVGVNASWGETVTYAVSGTKAVTTTGTAPTGSSASYTQTYNTAKQMTSGNTTTLTLSGFDGCTITGVTISTKTNKSSGAGSFTVKVGGTQKGNLSVKELGSTYISKDITVTSTQVGNGETIVISGSCTTSSVYCESYTITYIPSGKTPLGTAANLSSSNVTDKTADLSWDAVSNASSYKVKIGSTEYETTTNSYQATGLEAETEHKWSVKALAGESDTYSDGTYSAEATFTTGTFVPAAGTYNIVPNNKFFNCNSFTTKPSGFTDATGVKYGVTVKYTAASSAYINESQCRAYTGTKLDFTAPEGFVLTSIVFTGSTWVAPKASVGTMSSKTWTGNANSVTLTFSGTSYMTNIAVTYALDRTLQSIAVSGNPTKTTYEAGESLDPAGLTVTGTYDEGDPEVITSGITWSTPDALVAGQTSVKITATVSGITSPEYEVTGLTVNAAKVPAATPTFTPAAGTYTAAQSVTIACATEGATIYYTTDGKTPTTSSTQYTEAINVDKTMTIKAIAVKEGMIDSEVATAAYTINLPVTLAGEGEGTEASPYDVTRALDYIAKKQDETKEVYVEGIISEIKSLDVSKYKTAQYYISKDGTETDQLLIFNGYYLNGADFSANDQIQVGYKVVVCGKLTEYNSTKEMAAGNKIVKLETASGKTTPTLKFSSAKVTAYLDAQDDFKAPTLSNESGVDVTYSSSNEDVATVDASGAVTLVGAGETTIKAKFEGNDEYNEASAEYTLTVKATKPAEYAIVAECNGKWYAATTVNNSNGKLVATEVRVVDQKVYKLNSDDDIVWNWDATAGSLTAASTDKKLTINTKGTNTNVSYSGEYATWTLDDKYGLVNKDAVSSERTLIYTTAYSGVFGNYKNSNIGTSGYSGKAQILPIGTAAELEAITSSVTVGSTGYATYCPIAYDVTIPSGVEVYYAESDAVNEDYILLSKYEGTTLKQGEGVILKNEGNYTFAKATDAATAIEGNLLVGAASDLTLKENAAYILAAKEGAAVFSLCTAGTLKGGKSYLPASAGSNAPALKLVVNDATGINNVTTRMQSIGNYNINGQMVDENYRGIVIVNGKKILKK